MDLYGNAPINVASNIPTPTLRPPAAMAKPGLIKKPLSNDPTLTNPFQQPKMSLASPMAGSPMGGLPQPVQAPPVMAQAAMAPTVTPLAPPRQLAPQRRKP